MNPAAAPFAATTGRTTLVEITRSRQAVLWLVLAAVFFAVGDALTCVGFAVLSPGNLRASRDLATSGEWLSFVATLAALAAVAGVAWHVTLTRSWPAGAELIGATSATLVISVGALVIAVNAPGGSNSGSIVEAVGIAGWMVVTLYNAGRRYIEEQAAPVRRQADLWLVATGSVFVLAVATGLPSPGLHDKGLAIAEGVLFAVGFVGLAAAVDLARRRGQIVSSRVFPMIVALWSLSGAFVVTSVAAGFVFSPSATLTTIRVGESLSTFAQAVGWLVVAVAVFGRLAELSAGSGPRRPIFRDGWYQTGQTPLPTTPPSPGSAWSPTPPGAEAQVLAPQTDPTMADPPMATPATGAIDTVVMFHCGLPVPPGSSYCPRCGLLLTEVAE